MRSYVLFLFLVAGAVPVEGQPRIITFADHEWAVRSSAGPTAPGGNTFSEDEEHVWLDDAGRLHMTLGTWATEVRGRRPLGYGVYEARFLGRFDMLDKNAVFGFFTFELPSSHAHNREIDVEFSRWGNAAMTNAQFSVQPSADAENRHRFELAQTGDATTHRFEWRPGNVTFLSWHGHDAYPPPESQVVARFEVTGEVVPEPERARPFFNFWRYQGKPLTDGTEHEVIITDFRFTPRGES